MLIQQTIAARVPMQQRSRDSTIYHRFGDRMGLGIAAEHRFLNRLDREWEALSTEVLPVVDNDEFLQVWLQACLSSAR